MHTLATNNKEVVRCIHGTSLIVAVNFILEPPDLNNPVLCFDSEIKIITNSEGLGERWREEQCVGKHWKTVDAIVGGTPALGIRKTYFQITKTMWPRENHNFLGPQFPHL